MIPARWTAWKLRLLDVAEVCDAWRIGPRAAVTFYLYELNHVTRWFMALPVPVDNAHAGFVGAVWGFLVPILGWYMSTGRKWT